MIEDDDAGVYHRRHGSPEWEAEGGEPLPPDPNIRRKLDSDEDLVTHLFTCVNCGRRLASPPGPPSDGICGNCGGDYVCHTFDPAEYQRIRWYSDPREPCPNCDEKSHHSEDGEHRICWECGVRWSP